MKNRNAKRLSEYCRKKTYQLRLNDEAGKILEAQTYTVEALK